MVYDRERLLSRRRSWRRLAIVISGVVCNLLTVLAAYQALLFAGGCDRPDYHRISTLRGQVVGRALGALQYRWLRRRFIPVGTRLELMNVPSHPGELSRRLGVQVIDQTGEFDFGNLMPGDYSLTVHVPGEDAYGVRFTIDPSVQNRDVLVDASPAYYCQCCGWEFEPRGLN